MPSSYPLTCMAASEKAAPSATVERAGRRVPRTRQDAKRELMRMKEHHSRGTAGGRLRAAIFGVNDGLVTNICLVIGVAAAAPDKKAVVLAGIAGLVAGAVSMAAGEFI